MTTGTTGKLLLCVLAVALLVAAVPLVRIGVWHTPGAILRAQMGRRGAQNSERGNLRSGVIAASGGYMCDYCP